MAVDTKQKRFSAIAVTQPWRGAPINPAETGFDAGNRAAASLLYSGIVAAAAATVDGIGGTGINDGAGITITIRITGLSSTPGITMDIT